MAEATLSAEHLALLGNAARETRPLALLEAADAVAREALGARLCTAMRFDAATMTVRRIFSSSPDAYPVGGSKPKRDTDWGRRVLLERRVFVGEGEAALRRHFDDHALILGLGVRSIVNVPIVLRGTCRGTMNLLFGEETVRPERLMLATLLGLVVTPEWAGPE